MIYSSVGVQAAILASRPNGRRVLGCIEVKHPSPIDLGKPRSWMSVLEHG
jgi:hypothetical protein